MDLSIVIVSYNTRDLLEACLRSLPAGCAVDAASPIAYELFVVDNASTDGSAKMVRERFPTIQLIESEINRGFAGGNNVALPRCRGRYVLLLNPDTEVAAGALATLVEFMDRHSEVGAVGPRLLNRDGSTQPSGYPFPTFADTATRLFLRHSQAPSRHATSASEASYERHDWLTGACLMVRGAVLEDVGPLDERYLFWWEDVDWCRRIRAAGWEICRVHGARVTHLGAASGIAYSVNSLRAQEGQCYYFRKHHGPTAERVMRGLFSCFHLLAWLKYTVRSWLRRDSGDRLKQRVHRQGILYSLTRGLALSRLPAEEAPPAPQ